jgi:hypothetical protein
MRTCKKYLRNRNTDFFLSEKRSAAWRFYAEVSGGEAATCLECSARLSTKLGSTKGFPAFSVADPGCLFRIQDPDFYLSRISDPGSKNSNKRERVKKISYHSFLCSHKFHKMNYFIFEMLKKKIWANFQRIIELFTQTNCH